MREPAEVEATERPKTALPPAPAWVRVPLITYATVVISVLLFLAITGALVSARGTRELGDALLMAPLAILLAFPVALLLEACLSGSTLLRKHYCPTCLQVDHPIIVCPDCGDQAASIARYTVERLRRGCGRCRPVRPHQEVRELGLQPCCRSCHGHQQLQPVLPIRTVGTLTAACTAQLVALGEEVTARFPHWDPEFRSLDWPAAAMSKATRLVRLDGLLLLVLDLPLIIREQPRYDRVMFSGAKLGAVWISKQPDPLELGRILDQLSGHHKMRGYLANIPVLVEAEALPAALTSRLREDLQPPQLGYDLPAQLLAVPTPVATEPPLLESEEAGLLRAGTTGQAQPPR